MVHLAMHRKLWPRCPVWRHCEINPRRKTKPLCRASSVLWMRWMAKCTRRCFWLNPFRWIRRRRFAVGTKICIAVFRLSAKVHTVYPALEAVEDKNLLPFAIDPFGNYICYQLNEKQIVYWDHENDAVTTTGKSLKEFIESLY